MIHDIDLAWSWWQPCRKCYHQGLLPFLVQDCNAAAGVGLAEKPWSSMNHDRWCLNRWGWWLPIDSNSRTCSCTMMLMIEASDDCWCQCLDIYWWTKCFFKFRFMHTMIHFQPFIVDCDVFVHPAPCCDFFSVPNSRAVGNRSFADNWKQLHSSDNSAWEASLDVLPKMCFTAVPESLPSKIWCSVIFVARMQCLHGPRWKWKLNIEVDSMRRVQCKNWQNWFCPQNLFEHNYSSIFQVRFARLCCKSFLMLNELLVASISIVANWNRTSRFWGSAKRPNASRPFSWGNHLRTLDTKPECQQKTSQCRIGDH